MADRKRKTGHFGRLDALYEGGWLAVLTASEIKLWTAYSKFAGSDGVAYPGNEELAKGLGHATVTHIGRTRKALADHGLLIVLEPGGGRFKTCTVQLVNPVDVTPPVKAKPCRSGKVSNQKTGPETLPICAGNLADLRTIPCRSAHLHNKEEQPKNHHEQPTLPAAPPPAAVSAVANGGSEVTPPEPKGGKFPPGVWKRACEGWFRAYEHVHGVRPARLLGRDAKALAGMLVALKSDVDALAAVIRAGLKQPNVGYWQGHRLHVIAENMDYLRGLIARGAVGKPPPANGRPSAGAARVAEGLEMVDRVFEDSA